MDPVPHSPAGRWELSGPAPGTLPGLAAWPRHPGTRTQDVGDETAAALATSEKRSLGPASPAGTSVQVSATPGTSVVASSRASPHSNVCHPS
jgi:hypothetical protein